jgi:hypothetical protein
MAYNMAMTIKATERDFPIAVLYNGAALNHLTDAQLALFDHRIDIGSSPGMLVKLRLDELSPFDRTLYVDVDMVWLPKKTPSQLFAELEGEDFNIITEGFFSLNGDAHDINSKYPFWFDPEAVRMAYPVKRRIYQARSEVMYFEKTDRVLELFDEARRIYNDPAIDVGNFADTLPDEFAFNIAMSVMDIDPAKYKWKPSFWLLLHGKSFPPLMELYRDYWLLSAGGNHSNGSVKKLYNTVVKAAAYKLGRQHLFDLQSKNTFLQERKKI